MHRLLATTLASSLASLVLFGVAAGARTITGTERADRLSGTSRADVIYGRGGSDRLLGRAGNDLVHGGPGRDTVAGQAGNDRIALQADGDRDSGTCGRGRDVVTAELRDAVARDCEIVSRELSRDPYRNPDSQHETEVEPDSFAFGSTVVTVFQAGRFFDGGASNIGFATSTDAGRSWTSGFLPRLTRFSMPAGEHARVSDPVVAYDAVHGVWLAASLGVSPRLYELLVSRSTDGLTWTAPVTAARATTSSLAYDKEWIVCDNWPGSRFRGSCYLSYTDVRTRRLATQTSTDGGLTWSNAAGPQSGAGAPGSAVSGAQPVVRPDGTLVVVFTSGREGIAATRSTDGGRTFGTAVAVSALMASDVVGMRAPPLPSVDVDASGQIYVAWHGCELRSRCTGNDILLRTSADGRSWSRPTRVSPGGAALRGDHFVPGLAVEPGTAGGRARLGIAYYRLQRASCPPASCRLDVHLVTSRNGGASWSRAQRLNAESMQLSWIADTNSGRMVGDYISTSFAGGRVVAVFSLASAPVGGRFKQATFATALPR